MVVFHPYLGFLMCHYDGSAPRERMFLGGDGLVWFGPMMIIELSIINREEGQARSKSSMREESLKKRRALMLAGEEKVVLI